MLCCGCLYRYCLSAMELKAQVRTDFHPPAMKINGLLLRLLYVPFARCFFDAGPGSHRAAPAYAAGVSSGNYCIACAAVRISSAGHSPDRIPGRTAHALTGGLFPDFSSHGGCFPLTVPFYADLPSGSRKKRCEPIFLFFPRSPALKNSFAYRLPPPPHS